MTVRSLPATTLLTMALGLIPALRASAQSTPPPGVTIPPNLPNTIEQTIPTPSQTPPPRPPIAPTAPPPTLEVPAPGPLPVTPSLPTETFVVKQIEVTGNTILHQAIKQLTQPYENTEITFDDLLKLRSEITALYEKQGYITSGAFLPNNQLLDQGIVRIQVIEGRLEQLDIAGLNRLRDRYVRRQLELATRPPLNRDRLEEALQLLQLDPVIDQVKAELTAGSTPGQNILRVEVTEARAFHLGAAIANDQSPSIGSVQGSFFVYHDNLTGWGDRFGADVGKTAGSFLYDLSYTLPVTPQNGTISLRYSNNDSEIIESPFDELEIRSTSRTLSLSARQPLVRSPDNELAIGIAFDLRRSQTFILDDIPFSFSEGPDDGESKVTVIRLFQDWTNRKPRRVLAARSQFSIGINAFGATINDTGTDGRFFSWLGQFQWVQQLSPRVLLLTRFAAQFTPDSLLSLERFSLGGFDTVRGFRQNQVVADNGIIGSVELRIPVTRNPTVLQLTPFIEVGKGWNNRGDDPEPGLLASAGLGLRYQLGNRLSVRLDYGIPLVNRDDSGNSLQDRGLFFSVRYQPL